MKLFDLQGVRFFSKTEQLPKDGHLQKSAGSDPQQFSGH